MVKVPSLVVCSFSQTDGDTPPHLKRFFGLAIFIISFHTGLPLLGSRTSFAKALLCFSDFWRMPTPGSIQAAAAR